MSDSRITAPTAGGARVMVTNNGHHSVDFEAQVTAEQIAPIHESVTGVRRFRAMELQGKIAMALIPHHQKVRDREADKLTEEGDRHLRPVAQAEPQQFLDDAMAAIQEAARGSEWEKQFTFDKKEPPWLPGWMESVASYDEKVKELCAAQDLPALAALEKPRELTPDEVTERDEWMRQCYIRFEVSRHFGTAQQALRSIHRDKLAAAAQ